MSTTFAERWQQGVEFAEKLVEDAREVLPEGTAGDVEKRVAGVVRRARSGLERASDARDAARIAVRRHPFAATAAAFGIGAMVGVAVGRLAEACAARTRSTTPAAPVDVDPEC